MRVVEFRHNHVPVFNPEFRYEEKVSVVKSEDQAEDGAEQTAPTQKTYTNISLND